MSYIKFSFDECFFCNPRALQIGLTLMGHHSAAVGAFSKHGGVGIPM